MNILRSARILYKSCKLQDSHRQLFTSPVAHLFYERSKKDKYDRELAEKVPKKKLILDGLKQLKNEIKMWRDELSEKLKNDPVLVYRPGEVDVAFQFDQKNELDRWIVTADSDHNEGFSTATFEKSPAGYAMFSGYVQSAVPKDGRVKRAGYCNIRSQPVKKSFQRDSHYDWSMYNTLVLKIRGDGRNYLINLHSEGYFDVLWHDIYHYVLYTRGGPHWQVARIPFSKFFLSSKGRIQDKQAPIALQRVTGFGLSVGAKGGTDGPFSLELAYIGLEFDPNHTEEFAYEMYKTPKYLAAT